MKLTASPDEISKLTKLGVLKVKSKDEFFIETKPDLNGTIHSIDVEIGASSGVANKILDYEKYWEAFPTPSEIKKALAGIGVNYTRNLRTGSKDTIQKRLVKLSKTYSPQEILDIIKYEVKIRTEESMRTGKNKFEFMQGAEPWSNNEGNISTMYAEMKEVFRGKNTSVQSNNSFDTDFNFV